MGFDLLLDRSGILAALINAEFKGDRLCCGLAIFRGGLVAPIRVSSGDRWFKIKIPDGVKEISTYTSFADEGDRFEILVLDSGVTENGN